MRARVKYHPAAGDRPACWSVPSGRGCHACGEDRPTRTYSLSRENVEALLEYPPMERADVAGEAHCSIHCLIQSGSSPFWRGP